MSYSRSSSDLVSIQKVNNNWEWQAVMVSEGVVSPITGTLNMLVKARIAGEKYAEEHGLKFDLNTFYPHYSPEVPVKKSTVITVLKTAKGWTPAQMDDDKPILLEGTSSSKEEAVRTAKKIAKELGLNYT